RLGEGVLHRLARRDVVPGNLVIVGPLQDGVRRQLGAIVAHDRLWLAALIEKPIELTSNPNAGDRGVGDERQALARAIVDHNEDTKAAPIKHLTATKASRPASVRPSRTQHRRPCAQGPLAPPPPSNHEPFLAIDSKQPLMVHKKALPSQQHVEPPIAEAPALMGESPQPLS